MFGGRIFSLICYMLCLEATKGTLKITELNYRSSYILPANSLGNHERKMEREKDRDGGKGGGRKEDQLPFISK